MSATVLFLEEPPLSESTCEIARLLEAEGYCPSRVEWSGTPPSDSRNLPFAAIFAFPSMSRLDPRSLLTWIERRDIVVPIVIVMPQGRMTMPGAIVTRRSRSTALER